MRRAIDHSRLAVAYLRVSTEEQAIEGVSLDAQRAAAEAYCAMRGIVLAEVVVDAGVSAGKPLATREGGHRVTDLVRRGEVGAVVAWKLDRLFRDCADCLTTVGEWDRRGVSVHLVDLGGQSIDSATAMGRFFLTVLAGAAEMERNLIRERTRCALGHKRARGERTGQVPFGYRLGTDGVSLEPDDAEQAAIALVRELRASGLTQAAIAERLTSDGVPSRGARWHPTTVARILRRAA